MQEYIDEKLGKWASRKLFVFFIATILCIIGKVDSSDWTYIAIAYVTLQGVVDATEFMSNYFKK